MCLILAQIQPLSGLDLYKQGLALRVALARRPRIPGEDRVEVEAGMPGNLWRVRVPEEIDAHEVSAAVLCELLCAWAREGVHRAAPVPFREQLAPHGYRAEIFRERDGVGLESVGVR